MREQLYVDLSPADALNASHRADVTVLDVRTPGETQAAHIPGSQFLPLDQLPAHIDTLDPDAHTLVVCAHGIRSVSACAFLADRGFAHLYNLRGGLSAWTGPLQGTAIPPPQSDP